MKDGRGRKYSKRPPTQRLVNADYWGDKPESQWNWDFVRIHVGPRRRYSRFVATQPGGEPPTRGSGPARSQFWLAVLMIAGAVLGLGIGFFLGGDPSAQIFRR
jgi:hypothetical protein